MKVRINKGITRVGTENKLRCVAWGREGARKEEVIEKESSKSKQKK